MAGTVKEDHCKDPAFLPVIIPQQLVKGVHYMKLPLQITARNIVLTEAIEAVVRKKARKLERFYDGIMSCRVVVEAPHRHHNKGVLYNASIDITIPGSEVVVKREPHEDLYVAIRDAFEAARRQLQNISRKQRGEVKFRNRLVERSMPV